MKSNSVDLRVEWKKTMPVADLGIENPLPGLMRVRSAQDTETEPDVPPEIRANMGYGFKPDILPYTVLDGYSRKKKETAIKTIVLENDFLRATFLPTYGGRLWSLFDKAENRDLIYENPVIQPANLAIRNAWLSGGVEWNIGLRGHSPFTCADVFTAVTAGNGYPVLRMYEFERIRQVPYSIDFLLPPDSRLLFVFVKIRNPHNEPVPMYWWSNIAYPEHPETRVVVPADRAYRFGYGKKGLGLIDVPQVEGIDVSYSVNLKHSADFFFDIPPSERKWIAALDEGGTGLFQTSTDRLLGRKLFVWGTGPGGNAWQEFLSVPGKPYIEIQAGLAHTQMEHIPMPGCSEWSWLEAYGCVKAEPKRVHGPSWHEAYETVGTEIAKLLPEDELERMYSVAASGSHIPIDEVLHQGSGWGYLENEYRKIRNESPLTGNEMDFGSEPGAPQLQWMELLRDGTFPTPDPGTEPTGYEVEPKWRALLEAYLGRQPENWYAWVHAGVMAFADNDIEDARRAWTRSIEVTPNPWAYRNLAQIAASNGDLETATEFYAAGFTMLDDCIPYTIEYGNALLEAGKAAAWIELYERLPVDRRRMGRFQLLYARGLLAEERLDEALAVLESNPEVTDLREGENSLTEIWFQIHERMVLRRGGAIPGDLREYVRAEYPPPAQIDFRMKT